MLKTKETNTRFRSASLDMSEGRRDDIFRFFKNLNMNIGPGYRIDRMRFQSRAEGLSLLPLSVVIICIIQERPCI